MKASRKKKEFLILENIFVWVCSLILKNIKIKTAKTVFWYKEQEEK